MYSSAAIARFERKVLIIDDAKACWPWIGGYSPRGYGKIQIGDKHLRANRIALEIKLGRSLAVGMLACHECDNTWCVRPDHLFEGTVQDNSDDKVSKGRQARGESFARRHALMPRGEAHGMSKLTVGAVREIRRCYTPGRKPGVGTLSALGARFGVDRTLIHQIVARKIWAHVGPDPERTIIGMS